MARYGQSSVAGRLWAPVQVKMFGRRLVLLLAAAVCFCQICLVLLQKAVVSELQVKRVTGEQEMVYNSSYCQCQRVISVRELKVNPEVVWCSREASLRGNHQKIIAYSLFGNVNKRTSKYWTSLMTIAAQAKKLYPGTSGIYCAEPNYPIGVYLVSNKSPLSLLFYV